MVVVDQLVRDRRRFRQDSEPAEWVDPLKCLDGGGRYAGAEDAVELVAAGAEILQARVVVEELALEVQQATGNRLVRVGAQQDQGEEELVTPSCF